MKEPIKHRRKFKEAKVSFVWVEGELCRSWKKEFKFLALARSHFQSLRVLQLCIGLAAPMVLYM